MGYCDYTLHTKILYCLMKGFILSKYLMVNLYCHNYNYNLCSRLSLIQEIAMVSEEVGQLEQLKKDVFSDGGCLATGYEYDIEVNENAKPFSPPARRLAPAVAPKVRELLSDMVQDGIIEEVVGVHLWWRLINRMETSGLSPILGN